MPLVTIVAAALELPEMFWIIFPVADKVCQAILNSIHGIGANQGIGDRASPASSNLVVI